MSWIIRDNADKAILAEIKQQTDRGAALIATAYLEERFVDAIKARLVNDETLQDKLFKGYGPLGREPIKL